MKTLFTMIFLIFFMACGRSGGSTNSSTIAQPLKDPGNCKIHINGAVDFKMIALKADEMRRICHLTEEEIIGRL